MIRIIVDGRAYENVALWARAWYLSLISWAHYRTRHNHLDDHTQPFRKHVKNWLALPENMIRNMNSTFGLIFQPTCFAYFDWKRYDTWTCLRPCSTQRRPNRDNVDFKPLLKQIQKYHCSEEEIDGNLQPNPHQTVRLKLTDRFTRLSPHKFDQKTNIMRCLSFSFFRYLQYRHGIITISELIKSFL